MNENNQTDAQTEIAATNLIVAAAKFFEQAADFVPVEFLQRLVGAQEIAVTAKLKPLATLTLSAKCENGELVKFDMPIQHKKVGLQ